MMRPMLFLASALLCATSASATCANDCNGHGTCNIYSSCDCYRNWMGADCSQRVCYFGIAFVDTPQGDLNTDGYVSDNQYNTRFTNEQTWEVYPWYAGYGGLNFHYKSSSQITGPEVDVTGDMQGEGHFYKECSSKGICDRDSGVCECFPGFDGEGCSRTACANDCSGHGLCRRIGDIEPQYAGWDAASTQACVCDAGYMGADCSLRSCPAGDDAVTKYKGYTRISFIDADSGAYYDTTMCPVAEDNKADSSYPAFGESNNRLWDFKIDTENPHANGWQWNPWFYASAYNTAVYEIELDAALPLPAGTVVTGSSGAEWIILDSVDGLKSDKFIAASVDGTPPVEAVTSCASPVGSIPDDFPTTWPDTSANSDCTGRSIDAMTAIHDDYLCSLDTTESASTNQLCTDTAVTVHTQSALASYADLLVTGNTSQATGYATSSCSVASECDFWSLYLERTEGTFQYGDVIQIGSSSAGNSVYHPAFEFSLCNYIASIDMYYSAAPTAVQENEVQMLSLYLRPAAVTDKYQVRSIYPWVTSPLRSADLEDNTEYTATWTDSDDGTTACTTFPYAKFSTDSSGDPIKSTIKFQDGTFGVCTHTGLASGLKLTLSGGTDDITVNVQADPDHMVALGYLDQSMGDLTGDFQGYFALEFTDETGDTWMTESVAVSSTTVDHDDDGTNMVNPTSDIITQLSSQTAKQAAGIPADGRFAFELEPAATADFIATSKQTSAGSAGGLYLSDLRSGQVVADRIEAALEALPNGVLSDVEVYYQHTMPDLDGATLADLQAGFTKNFRISFVSNSGDVPALRVAYSFVDSDGHDGIAGRSGRRTTFQNSNCGGLTGSLLTESGSNGCAVDSFGEASILDTRALATGDAWPIYRTGAEITTVSNGTTENAECSNRGLCDYATGECKCFSGFTDMDCSTQNALSMG